MRANFSSKEALIPSIYKWSVFFSVLFYDCNSDIVTVENMRSHNLSIIEENPIFLQKEKFDPSNTTHVSALKEIDKIDIYYEIPGFKCQCDIFDPLNLNLYENYGLLKNRACVFIPIENFEIQGKSIEKQAEKINKSVNNIRERFSEEIVKRFKLGAGYFDIFREIWIGFSQGAAIAFECWWQVSKSTEKLLHRLVICNNGLFGCSLLDPLSSIINYIPEDVLPLGVKDLSKEASMKRVGEKWRILNKQNCLLAGNLSSTEEDKTNYVHNMFASIDFDHLKLQPLIGPFLPEGDCCYSAKDQFPKKLKELGIRFVPLKGHHVESLLISENAKTLAHAIISWDKEINV